MCGIFGLVPSSATPFFDVAGLCEKLFAALALRGPDDRGYVAFAASPHDSRGSFTEKTPPPADIALSLLLGHTRLSIIDLSHAGHQPMFSPDGNYGLVFNGEIYNYIELREELKKKGVRFYTATDSEVLLQALINWGTDCLPRLTGMFAFGFYDRIAGTLLLARDCFGIKPLFYASSAQIGLAFASELPAMLLFPCIGRQLDYQSAYNYLALQMVDVCGRTMLRDVRQLEAAHYLLFDLTTRKIAALERWWQVPLPEPRKISFADAAFEARELFLNSVRLHLRSDVPLGVALSGGVDSSAVACAVRHLEPDMPLHTFTYVAADCPEICEEKWADVAAEHAGAIAHKVLVHSSELCRDLDNLLVRQGEPFTSASIYAQYRVFQLAHESGIVVTLEGQGADEMLAGYNGYPVFRMQTLAGQKRWRELAEYFRVLHEWPVRNRNHLLKQFMKQYFPVMHKIVHPVLRLRRFILRRLGLEEKSAPEPRWLNKDFLCGHNACAEFVWKTELYHSPDKVREILAWQLTEHGLPNLLRHADRNSMSFSIESRVPFCTREMAEFFLSLPEEYLLDRQGWTKSIFRAAMRGIMPDSILDRRDKIGFQTPEKAWFAANKEWVEESLSAAAGSPLFNHTELLRTWRMILRDQRPFNWRVWRWINYLRWKQLLKITE